MAMREYNTYDLYGLLQGVLDALSRHANAIPLQARADLATAFIRTLPEHAEDIQVEVTEREKPQLRRPKREPTPKAPTLSPLGEMLAH